MMSIEKDRSEEMCGEEENIVTRLPFLYSFRPARGLPRRRMRVETETNWTDGFEEGNDCGGGVEGGGGKQMMNKGG